MAPNEDHSEFSKWADELEPDYCIRIERVLELPIREAMKAAFDAGYNTAWRKSFLRGTEVQE